MGRLVRRKPCLRLQFKRVRSPSLRVTLMFHSLVFRWRLQTCAIFLELFMVPARRISSIRKPFPRLLSFRFILISILLFNRCSVSALVVLGAAIGIDGTGVSQSMNLIWHQPAKLLVPRILLCLLLSSFPRLLISIWSPFANHIKLLLMVHLCSL
jgi:hypothetical protein